MSVMSKGKGRRTTTRMKVENVGVSANEDGGLSLTFYGRGEGKSEPWVCVSLDKLHADSLRSLVRTADEMGPSEIVSRLNRAGLAAGPKKCR